jgi:Mrp family chromosome partitioning ATPase
MTSGGADALKAALRRSLWLILALIVFAIAAVNVFKQLDGPRYGADARVLISTTPLSSIVTGTQPSFVDPERILQTALRIADSPGVYRLAADQTSGRYGDAEQLESATSVAGDPDSDIVTFSAEDSDEAAAVGTANAVARSYISFRDRLSATRISKTIAALQSSVEALPVDSTERDRLEAELSRLEVLQGNADDAQLVEEAVDAEKVSPAPLKDTLLGLAIGLVIALIVVALREAIDTTVRSEAEVEDLLEAPVVATVRSLPARTRMVTYGRHEPLFTDSYALLAAQLARKHGGEQKFVLAVTSAVSKEGKTTTAANLAVAMARRGKDVMLADFDFRKPTIAELFGIPSSKAGALQAMSGDSSLDSVLWSVALTGPRPRASLNGGPADSSAQEASNGEPAMGSLRVLPSGGTSTSAPPESQLRALLAALRREAEIVILDTPPALLTAEMAELSHVIDSILVVVRQGRVSQRNLSALGRQARTWPAQVSGAVMTDMPRDAKRSYYRSR